MPKFDIKKSKKSVTIKTSKLSNFIFKKKVIKC